MRIGFLVGFFIVWSGEGEYLMGDKIHDLVFIYLKSMISNIIFYSPQPKNKFSFLIHPDVNQTKNDPNLSCEIIFSPSPVRSILASLPGRKQLASLTLALLFSAHLIVPPQVDAAGEPGQFLSWGAGARSLGMGKAFIGISDDASATYWNPAGMVQVPRKELMVLQASLFEDTTFSFLSYIHPTSKYGVWGVNLTRLNSGGFEKVKVTVDPSSTPENPSFSSIEKVGDFSVSQQAFTFAYGKQVTNKMSMGLAAKRITNTVDSFSQAFMAIDASIFARINDKYRTGFVIGNAVAQSPGNSDDRLPLLIKFGNSYSLLKDRVILAADINHSGQSGMGWNLGTEYWATRKVAIRLGLENRDGEIAETSAGMGFNFRRLGLDFAFGLGELGMTQRFSLTWKFGKTASDDREKQVERLVRAGNTAFARGNYAQAVAKLDAAYSMDPSNQKIRQMIDKLSSIAGSIPSATGDGELDRLVRQGVTAYVSGDLNTSYDSLRTAYEKNPSNQRLMNFTNRVARLAGQPLVEPPNAAVSGARWTLIDQKLHEALTAIYEGRYDISINKCEEVLRIDPSNVTAIGRMGAAFFLLGEKDKAITLWKRALELEPNNKTAIEYLKQLGAYQ